MFNLDQIFTVDLNNQDTLVKVKFKIQFQNSIQDYDIVESNSSCTYFSSIFKLIEVVAWSLIKNTSTGSRSFKIVVNISSERFDRSIHSSSSCVHCQGCFSSICQHETVAQSCLALVFWNSSHLHLKVQILYHLDIVTLLQ